MDPVQDEIPEEFRSLYVRHWNTIRTSVKEGRLKDVYHFPLFSDDNNEIKSRLQETMSNHKGKIKINVAFGFILRNRNTDELKFFHPSNNTMLLDTPRLIMNGVDRRLLEDDIERQDAFEYARQQRPSSHWFVEKIICIRFDVYKLIV